ncbi:MAG TPA: hypothetical protein VMV83_00685 [Rectinemataceae bacterium]|nr:hypothetical protein [Rectinemataceae bacterium]
MGQLEGWHQKPSFKKALKEILGDNPNTFNELRRLVDEGFTRDPAAWHSGSPK